MRIPTVAVYRIKLEDGRTFHVLAPTRKLAILNLRTDARNWGAVKSCGRTRIATSGHPSIA